ncbi:uncharacterized protein LOC123509096 [Portunus trituberculatus]|uniref:uncharacterized protein LOC123509096 n=1 Tax=Portunus trituberculatus TaxID=210409 RepID=UPI001E1CFC93|nr:uncharacterized protein LOC123509096 [Portunus trituberculatus]
MGGEDNCTYLTVGKTITSVSASVPTAHHLYVDGSLQADGTAACAVFSSTVEPPRGDGWVGRRLPNASSSIYCELNGLLDAVTILTERGLDGVIVCDSKSALHALSSPRPAYDHVVRDILCRLATARDSALVVSFLWVPSHVGLTANDTVDGLAKAACGLPLPAVRAAPSLRCYRNTLFSAVNVLTVNRRNTERADSVSIHTAL